MLIKSVHVQNFRCLLDATLPCEPLTAIVGPNGCGKSSFLRALELFYAVSPRFSPDDYYNGDTSQDIAISVTFSGLSAKAKELFASYLEGGELTVTRTLSLQDGKPNARFFGTRLQNADFRPVRQAGNATEARQKYNEIRQQTAYSTLPSANSQAAVTKAMDEWEQSNLDRCTRLPDDGQFFGFTEVAQGYLGRFTKFVSIPAVRDAAEDAVEGKGRPITELMDMVVRTTLARSAELQDLQQRAQSEYESIVKTATFAKLDELQETLTGTLKTYVPGAEIELEWVKEGGIEIRDPKADVKLVEDGYSAAVVRTGHGLQRAFILTMLQHLATTRSQPDDASPTGDQDRGEADAISAVLPDLVLGIEEPELYQHPSRQRHFAKLMLGLAKGAIPGVSAKTQVLYATHSPLFVGIDRFDQVRVLRKAKNTEGLPKVTKVVCVEGNSVAEALWEACDRKDGNGKPVSKFTWETLKPRLQTIMTPWVAEGFFADVAVLVEGEDDRAAILGAATLNGHDLEALGISVLPCGGKNNIDRPAEIFRQFGIPVYMIWDGDKGKKEAPRQNQILLRVAGAQAEDWPCGVYQGFACFENKLEESLRADIGEPLFSQTLMECREEYGYSNDDDALKSPHLVGELLRQAKDKGANCATLNSIVMAMLALKQGER